MMAFRSRKSKSRNRASEASLAKLAKFSYSEFRRLSPAENEKAGFSAKARHYVLASVGRVTTASPTIPERQYKNKRTLEKYNLMPEAATRARALGALEYETADQAERVAKASETRFKKSALTRIDRMRAAAETVPSQSPDKSAHGRFHKLDPDSAQRYLAWRDRKLRGEDTGPEWFPNIDIAKALNDPKYALLRASPGAFAFPGFFAG